MKRMYATGRSALQLYRCGEFPRPHEAYAPADHPSRSAVQSIGELRALINAGLLPTLEPPYELLVFGARARRPSRSLICRPIASAPEEPFLVEITEGCSCVIPELFFVQQCRAHEVPALAALGMELCGSYARGVAGPRPAFTRYHLPPLMTTSSLASFIGRNPRIRGSAEAKRILGYLADESASPMETALFLLITLPPDLGGYGLPKPELNAEIVIPGSASDSGKRQERFGDLVYRQERIVVEYQSERFHAQLGTTEDDEARREELEALGYTVMFITPTRIRDRERFDRFIRRLADRLGVNRPPDSPEIRLLRDRLTDELISS